jgi:predicted permease
MSQTHERKSIPPVYALAAGLYTVNAGISGFKNGWQQSGWIGWALMALGFVVLAQLPQETRDSFRRTLQNRMGITAMIICVVALALLCITPGV